MDRKTKSGAGMMTPSQAVKRQCIECLGLPQYNRTEIEACQGDTCKAGPCPLYSYRLGKRISVKVFRQFCIECMGGQRHLVADCPSRSCVLYPYRMGRNPARRGMGGKGFQNARERGEFKRGSTIEGQAHSRP